MKVLEPILKILTVIGMPVWLFATVLLFEYNSFSFICFVYVFTTALAYSLFIDKYIEIADPIHPGRKFFKIALIRFFWCLFLYSVFRGIGSLADIILTFLFSDKIIKNAKGSFMMNSTIKICSKCGNTLKDEDQFCPHCGQERSEEVITTSKSNIMKPSDYGAAYALSSEEAFIQSFINKTIKELKIDFNDKSMIPVGVLKRKVTLNIIYSILLFVYVALLFFHFPAVTYVIGLIILIIFYFVTKKFDFNAYLMKEIKARPNEKISNVLMNMHTTRVKDYSKLVLVFGISFAILLNAIIFFKPVIIYENYENGVAVRFYAFGITNFTSAKIPETHNGKKVLSLRGNTFSNMYFLKKVELPDSIVEIRGQAFKNCDSLVEIELPENLYYLGGGSFAGCKNLMFVTLPAGLEFLGGESFAGDYSLQKINLPEGLSEIRGDTFAGCSSLKTVTIPDKVSRIGGHAFEGCTNLSEVNISETSTLNEIGSSAFRDCYSLSTITIPAYTTVNERAFKNSNTIVYRFGESRLGERIDASQYKYQEVKVLSPGEKYTIENSRANAFGYYIDLEYIHSYNNQCEIKYYNGSYERDIILNQFNTYNYLDKNVAIELTERSLGTTIYMEVVIYYN